jgi:predicted NBD/HSP70 family sugar kinase
MRRLKLEVWSVSHVSERVRRHKGFAESSAWAYDVGRWRFQVSAPRGRPSKGVQIIDGYAANAEQAMAYADHWAKALGWALSADDRTTEET